MSYYVAHLKDEPKGDFAVFNKRFRTKQAACDKADEFLVPAYVFRGIRRGKEVYQNKAMNEATSPHTNS